MSIERRLRFSYDWKGLVYNMEIERKFLVKEIPFDLSGYASKEIEQGYLCTSPVLRIRRKSDAYIFTYKSEGLMSREEIELPLTREAYEHLAKKCDGCLIHKTRYIIPDNQKSSLGKELVIEFDVFHDSLEGLLLAEVEFSSEEEANAYIAPDWFSKEVTSISTFHNSRISKSNPQTTLDAMHTILESDK